MGYSVFVPKVIYELTRALRNMSDKDRMTVDDYDHLAERLYKACDDAMAELPETLNMPTRKERLKAQPR